MKAYVELPEVPKICCSCPMCHMQMTHDTCLVKLDVTHGVENSNKPDWCPIKPEWISVKDELPEVNEHGVSEDVIICTVGGMILIGEYAITKNNNHGKWLHKDLESYYSLDYKVAYWKPLPKPPEELKENDQQ